MDLIKLLTSVITVISVFFGVMNNAPQAKVYAKSYVLIEASTARVVASSNEHERLPIASTTKIMTALITLEQPNIQEYFTVDSNAIKVEGTSMGLREGDQVNLYSLATGMLLPSGNDGANAAAVRIAGSIDKFAEIMNKRAKEIGMKNTNFVTPSGLHDENHFSTAYDMALLAKAAMKNKTFAEICGSEKSTVEFGNPLQKRTFTNHNKLVSEYEGCIGVKTGFTKKAGRCLVSAAEKDGVTLICVTLGASDDWNLHKSLFDYGFSSVKPIEIPVSNSPIFVNVVGGASALISAVPDGKTLACIANEDVDKLEQEILLDKFYYAPIKAGSIVGELRHYLNGEHIASTTLVAGEGVEIPLKKKKMFGK